MCDLKHAGARYPRQQRQTEEHWPLPREQEAGDGPADRVGQQLRDDEK